MLTVCAIRIMIIYFSEITVLSFVATGLVSIYHEFCLSIPNSLLSHLFYKGSAFTIVQLLLMVRY